MAINAAGVSALELLHTWIDYHLDEPASDARARMQDLHTYVLPGHLPDDYAAVLLEMRQTVALKDNAILAIEPPPPSDPAIFQKVSPNPPLDILYGLGDGHYNVIKENEDLSEWRLPKGLIAIGKEIGGSRICLDLSEAGNGRIYHWFQYGDPGPDVDGGAGWGNTFLLAYSFTDLCRRLRPAPPVDLSGKPVGKVCFVRPGS